MKMTPELRAELDFGRHLGKCARFWRIKYLLSEGTTEYYADRANYYYQLQRDYGFGGVMRENS